LIKEYINNKDIEIIEVELDFSTNEVVKA